jgi:hypothetical protein
MFKALRALLFRKRDQTTTVQRCRETGGVLALRLLEREAVREELGFTPEQTTAIGRLIRDVRHRNRKRLAAVKELDQRKRQSEFRKLMIEVAGSAIQRIDKAKLLTDEQKKRLRQIVWQERGCQAFLDPRLRNALDLTVTQEKRIMAILQKADRRARALRRNGPADATGQLRARVAAVRRATLRRTLGVLSDEQRRRWRRLRGKPFATHADRSEAE